MIIRCLILMFSSSSRSSSKAFRINVAIRRYRRVFCLRSKQYVQNYMHTPRNTNWRCTRAAFAYCEEFPLSLWLRMNAFWSISHCMDGCIYRTYCRCDVAHAIPNPIVWRAGVCVCVLECVLRLFASQSICMYAYAYISWWHTVEHQYQQQQQ